MAEKTETNTSLVLPFASLGVLALLAIVGILGIILIAVHPVFRMLAYVGISAATIYYIGKVVKLKRPIYFLGSFFALITLLIVAPAFMTLFPLTDFAVTGEAALAQATAGEGATQSQAILAIMPVIAAGTLAGIAAGRAKTTIQLILLSLVAVLVSIFIIFGLLVVG